MAQEKQPKAAKPKSRKPRASNRKPAMPAEPTFAVACPEDAQPAPVSASAKPDSIVLPECMDSSAAEHVKDLLLSARGGSIKVDASQVRRVGVQSLQILLAASRTWKREGHAYAVVNPSAELTGTIALLGLAADELSIGDM